jgi:hypothetical protein
MTSSAECGAVVPSGNNPDYASLHPGYKRRGSSRARPGPSALPHIPIHNVKQRSLLRSRGAFLRSGFAFLFSIRPDEGRAERRKAQYFCCRAVGRDDPRLLRRGASHGGGTLASRRSTVAILGRGPRFLLRHFLRISAASSSQPGRNAWRAGSRTSRGHRLRAAAAGRHSPLRLRLVSGDGPSDERGFSHHTINTNGSQFRICIVAMHADRVQLGAMPPSRVGNAALNRPL